MGLEKVGCVAGGCLIPLGWNIGGRLTHGRVAEVLTRSLGQPIVIFIYFDELLVRLRLFINPFAAVKETINFLVSHVLSSGDTFFNVILRFLLLLHDRRSVVAYASLDGLVVGRLKQSRWLAYSELALLACKCLWPEFEIQTIKAFPFLLFLRDCVRLLPAGVLSEGPRFQIGLIPSCNSNLTSNTAGDLVKFIRRGWRKCLIEAVVATEVRIVLKVDRTEYGRVFCLYLNHLGLQSGVFFGEN